MLMGTQPMAMRPFYRLFVSTRPCRKVDTHEGVVLAADCLLVASSAADAHNGDRGASDTTKKILI